MARSILFKKLKRCLQLAHIANKHDLSDQHIKDLLNQNKTDASRRRFIQQAAAAALMAAPGINLLSLGRAYAASDAEQTVAIVGAGAAGLAAAYQLKKAGVKFFLYDWTNRVGGRIMTRTKLNADDQFVERGAELVDTNHWTLRGLAAELGVEIQKLDEGDGSSEIAKEIYSFEGKTYTLDDMIIAIKPLAKVIAEALKASFGEENYLTAQNKKDLPEGVKYDNMSLKAFLEAQSDIVPKWVLSAIDVAYLCEYGMETDKQSAINLICEIDSEGGDSFSMFGDSDESMRVKGGNENLIHALRKALDLQEGKNFITGVRLTAVRENANNTVDLVFDRGGNTATKTVGKVICAVPFSVLRDVEGFQGARNGKKLINLNPEKLRLINEIGYGTNVKMMLSFKERFWKNAGNAIQACEGTLYCDTVSQSFWETSRAQAGKRGILTNFLGGNQGMRVANGDRAVSVDTALKDLSSIYGAGVAQANYENVVELMPWPIIPWVKGSYTSPSVGQYTSIWGTNADVELSEKLYFAGEHTHPLSFGFMNGAYSSGIRAANEVLASMKKKIAPTPGRDLWKAAGSNPEDADN